MAATDFEAAPRSYIVPRMDSEPGYSGRGRRPKALGPRTHKRCARCGQVKPVDHFNLRRKGSTAYAAYCKLCSSGAGSEWARNNRDRASAAARAWRAANPGRIKEFRGKIPSELRRRYDRDSYERHAEKRRARRRAYYHANKEQQSERNREWRALNPGKNAAKSMAYEARKKQAMPAWADRAAIDAVYERCAAMNRLGDTQYQVDHIMPLASPIMCGLHVDYNLQIIPARENQSKGNRVSI